MTFRSYVEYPLAVFIILATVLFAWDANAVVCGGKTAQNINTSTTVWSPPDASTYANATGIWLNTSGNALTLDDVNGAYGACLYWGGYEADLDPAKDADTYYQCPGVTGWEDHDYPGTGPCYPYHQGGSPTGISLANATSNTVEYAQVFDEGDGIAIEKVAENVLITASWLKFVHDDAIEDDWCASRDIVIDDIFIDKAFMAFAFDLRGQEEPCTTRNTTASITNSIVRLHRFTNAYKGSERPGHGGLFKDDQGGENPFVTDFSNNVILFGPVAGDGQVQFPLTDVLGTCENNVYLWQGTQAAYDAMLLTGGAEDNDSNGERLDDLHTLWGADCATIVIKGASETEAQFRARSLTELGSTSYNQLTTDWTNAHGFTGGGGGCGIGFELALVLPVLAAVWRRRHPLNRLR